MCARPTVATVAAHDGGRRPRLDRHAGQRNREDLARAAVVERRREPAVDVEPPRDLLVEAVHVVGAAADDAIDVGVLQAGLVERLADRLLEQPERRETRYASELALAGADDRILVPQRMRHVWGLLSAGWLAA